MANGPFYDYIPWPIELTSVFFSPAETEKTAAQATHTYQGKKYINAANQAGKFLWENAHLLAYSPTAAISHIFLISNLQVEL